MRVNTLKAVNVIFFLLFAAGLDSCRSQVISNQAQNLVISMERTSCFGTCPVYKVEIFDSGLIKFTGESHHEMIGNYRSHIDWKPLQVLREKFRQANFFSFKKEYMSSLQDLPSTYLYFKDGENEKNVLDYGNAAPAELKNLEQAIDELIRTNTWKKAD